MRISVIAEITGDIKTTGKCIESLQLQSMYDFEIIALANKETAVDGFLKNITVVNYEAGFKQAIDKALNIAKGEYICFVRGVCLFDYDFLKYLSDQAVSSDADYVCCGVYSPHSKSFLRYSPAKSETFLSSGLSDKEINKEFFNCCTTMGFIKKTRISGSDHFGNFALLLIEIAKNAGRILLLPDPKIAVIPCRNDESDFLNEIDYSLKLYKNLKSNQSQYCDLAKENLQSKIKGLIKDAINKKLRIPYKREIKKILKEILLEEDLTSKLKSATTGYLYFPLLLLILNNARMIRSNIIKNKKDKTLYRKMLEDARIAYNKPKTTIDENVKIFLVGSPEYNNLGDHAIAYATDRFLKTEIPEMKIIEITESDILNGFTSVVSLISEKDIIVLPGGGNLGNQYHDQSFIRNLTIDTFTENRIIIFPQTMYYTPNIRGRKARRKDIRVFSKHKDLWIIAREMVSYTLMKEYFKTNHILIAPDIVLTLKDKNNPNMRNGVILCLRNDDESALSINDIIHIKLAVRHSVRYTDTVTDRDIPLPEREGELIKFWDELLTAELVITDRLHCMIFCAITGTPCIAISNYNYKISGTFDWIKHFGYIKFCMDTQNIKYDIESITESTMQDLSVLYYNIKELFR